MLKTERLELVGFDVKYTNDLFELWSDFEIIKYTFTPLITTIGECINLIEHKRVSNGEQIYIDKLINIIQKPDNHYLFIEIRDGMIFNCNVKGVSICKQILIKSGME